MKNINRALLSLSALVLISGLFAAAVHAALIPTFLLGVGGGNSQVQVTVIGADPNALVTLYYPLNGSYTALSLPATDSTGRLSYLVSPSVGATVGGLAYVVVDGAQSQTQTWPAVTGTAAPASSGLSLSQSYLTITQGQNAAITASAGSSDPGALSVPANTNPSVAYVSSISGTQVSLFGAMPGSSTMTVCAANVGCTSLYVTVQAQSYTTSAASSYSNAVSLSPSSLTLTIGQSQTVVLSGPGSYYISGHSNAGVVSTSLSGSILTIGGLVAGTDNMSVCGTSGNSTSCTTLTATVLQSSIAANSSAQATISFNPNQVDLSIGQSQTVVVTGSGLGSYYISGNSNANAISANLNGNVATLTGVASGGANVTICQMGGACADVYGFVPVSGTSGTTAVTPTAATNLPLALSTFNISSNNVGNVFMGAGAALTFTYSFNQAISSQSLALGSQAVSSYGSGSGPYTAIYTMTGNEGAPITIYLTYTSTGGVSGQTNFTFGPGSGGATTAASASGSIGAGMTFTQYLYVGSTGSQVTALQNRLTALGIYSGPVTGTFGGQTEAAVKAYQAKHGLTQLGVVGPATRTLLNQGI